MAAPSTTEAFLSLVKQSGLVKLPRLQEYVQERLNSGGIPASARRIAQEMLSDGLLTKFQAEQILMGHYRKFEVAGKYRLLERVGEGGAAAVYLCEHQNLKRPVALKILPSWKTKSSEIVARFLREARAAAMVDHPNIVRVYDVEAAEANYFLVTEFVDGPNLETLVEATGPLAPARAARLVHEAALALQHAHEVGLVHRDVKPSNLLVDQSGHVKLLDLGLVKLTQIDDGLTQCIDGKTVLGTIDFQAPEQAVNSSDVDIRADIYSLGASFFFLLTGQVVFPDGTVAQKLSWHQQRTPPPLREIRPEIPERIAQIVARMLAKDPSDRFQEPAEVAQALEPWSHEPAQPLEEYELPKMSRAARVFLANWAARGHQGSSTTTPISRRPTPQPIPVPDRSKSPTSGRRGPNRWSLATAAVGITALTTALIVQAWSATHSSQTSTPGDPGSVIETSRVVDSGPPASPINPDDPPSVDLRSLATDARASAETTATIQLVSSSAPPRRHTSIQAALEASRPGDRIEVQGTRIRESVHWENRDRVTLASTNPDRSPVTWEPAGCAGDEPCCLRIQKSEGATVQGFQFDGNDNTPTLIRVQGHCPGLLLEYLGFRGALRPLALRATTGKPDRPESFRHLRFQRSGDSAIVFEAGSDDPDAPIESIRIELCRFEGPSAAAIRLDAPARSIEIRHCRFFGLEDGILYSQEADRAPIDVAVRSNTFHSVRRGLHFEHLKTPESNWVVQNNLFAETETLAQTDGLVLQPTDLPSPAAWIWTGEIDPKSARVPSGARPFRKEFSLESLPGQVLLEASADDSFEAWINGKPAGKSDTSSFDQRVRSFDVTRLLRPGKNVLAILAVNHAEPTRQGDSGSPAGLMARLMAVSESKTVAILTTDDTWKTNRSTPSDGWRDPAFDASDWEPAQPWEDLEDSEPTRPWTRTTWDSLIDQQVRKPIVIEVGGNARDDRSWEGYPNLAATRSAIHHRALPTTTADDSRFLRYARRNPLFRAGIDGDPVGLPQP